MFRIVWTAALLALAACPARAASCASVIPNAQPGPARQISDWRWGNACYVSWPGGMINGLDARLSYGALCQRVKGYLDFQGDARTKWNICIFASPDGDTRPAPQTVAKAEPKRESMWEDDVDGSSERAGSQLFSRGKTDLPVALKKLEAAKAQHLRKDYWQSYVTWSSAAGQLAGRDPDKTVRELSAYAKCMSELDLLVNRHRLSFERSLWDEKLTAKRCQGVTGEFVSETKAELQRLGDAYDEAKKAPALPSAAAAPGQTIPSRCLVIHETRDTGIACSTLKTWKKTLVTSPKGTAGCPDSIPISYVDDRGEEETSNVPAVIQSCGSGPLGIRITK